MMAMLKYWPKNLIWVMVILIVARKSVAGGVTLVFGELGRSVADPQALGIWFFVLLGLSLLGSFLVIPFRVLENRIYLKTYFEILRERTRQFSGPEFWGARQQKDSFLSALGPQMSQASGCFTGSLREVFTGVIGVLLQLGAFAVAHSPRLSLYLATSLLLNFAVNWAFKPSVDRRSAEKSRAQIDLFAVVGRAWDNLILGNPLVVRAFGSALQERSQSLLRKTDGVYFWSEFAVFVTGVAGWLPIVAFYFAELREPTQSPQDLAVIALLFPRMADFIYESLGISQMVTFLHMDRQAFATCLDAAKIPAADLLGRVRFASLSLKGTDANSELELLQLARAAKPGRVLVSGPNGAGKSSLLAWLQGQTPESFYLPVSADFILLDELNSRSSGQRAISWISHLRELDAKVVFLDEWDANLDEENRKHGDALIDELAQSRLVIEVRHGSARTTAP